MKQATPSQHNDAGQPVGVQLPDWQPPLPPPHNSLAGRFCRLEPLDAAKHGALLWEANAPDGTGSLWTYLPYGPFADYDEYRHWLLEHAGRADPLFFAIVQLSTQKPVGLAAFMRIDPPNGAMEVGHLCFSPALQKTPAATEAMYLMMKTAFENGYRRYEWKCNSLNLPSRRAAERLGFTFEGLFRQAAVVKGRNRDTTWYSVLDNEWPVLREAFEKWLGPDNFDTDGKQIRALQNISRNISRDRTDSPDLRSAPE